MTQDIQSCHKYSTIMVLKLKGSQEVPIDPQSLSNTTTNTTGNSTTNSTTVTGYYLVFLDLDMISNYFSMVPGVLPIEEDAILMRISVTPNVINVRISKKKYFRINRKNSQPDSFYQFIPEKKEEKDSNANKNIGFIESDSLKKKKSVDYDVLTEVRINYENQVIQTNSSSSGVPQIIKFERCQAFKLQPNEVIAIFRMDKGSKSNNRLKILVTEDTRIYDLEEFFQFTGNSYKTVAQMVNPESKKESNTTDEGIKKFLEIRERIFEVGSFLVNDTILPNSRLNGTVVI